MDSSSGILRPVLIIAGGIIVAALIIGLIGGSVGR